MSTGQLIEDREELPSGWAPTPQIAGRTAPGAPRAIALVLLLLVLYAAFDHGAVALSVNTRLEVAVAVIAALAGGAWLITRSVRISAPRAAIFGIGLLAAFTCWSGVTVLWSVAPDQTWIELNRAIEYALVLVLAIAVGASDRRAVPIVAKGFAAVTTAVTVYALGQKLFPGLRLAGVFNLNQTGQIPRLQEPLGYWNALALFIAMGVPIALALAADSSRTPRGRIAAGCVAELMLLTVGLTFSRGGLLALVLAVLVGIGVSANRLRSVLWLGLAIAATIPPLVFGLVNHSLTGANVPLSSREGAGAILAAILLASLAGLVVAARALSRMEPRLISRTSQTTLRRLAALAAATLVVAAALALALSSRGFTGTISHAWHTFTSTQTVSNYDPNRLLTTASNRWVWWKEAADAFGDRPVQGWGAGSFGVVHLLYRRNTLPVQQPHSVPLQFLAETGIVGTVLALAALALLLWAAAATVRRWPRGPERMLAAALLGAAFAYALHALYDWDWNIPAVTLPALLFLGVLVGSRRPAPPPSLSVPSAPARGIAYAALVLWLCIFVVSAVLPSLAASKASAALVEAASGSPSALGSAQSSAALATSLDPLADAGLRAEATIAIHRGRFARARAYLRQAVGRDPSDGLAWTELAQLDSVSGYPGEATLAARRAIALDPEGATARSLLRSGLLAAPRK